MPIGTRKSARPSIPPARKPLRRAGDERRRRIARRRNRWRRRRVELAQDLLAEMQHAVMPLVPCLDTLRWVFIAAALAGVAVAIFARIDD